MRRSVLTGVRAIEVGEGPDLAPGPGEVLVRVEACGVCGTDRHIVAGHYPMTFPITLGHEFAGTVVAVSSGVRTLGVGARVAVDPNVVCGVCAFCRRGAVHLCTDLTPLGITRPGGFAELSAVPEQNAYAIPDSMSVEAGAMLEPLACAIRGVQLAEIALGDVVVVLGGGPMGGCLVQLARLRGASCVIVSEPDEARRALARRLGADVVVTPGGETLDAVRDRTDGRGADVVFEAAGVTGVTASTVAMTRRGGTAMWFGVCPQGDTVPVEPFWVNEGEITIRGSFNNPFTHATAVALVAAGRVDVDALVTHRIPLERLAEAMDPAAFPVAFPGSMKLVVVPGMPASETPG